MAKIPYFARRRIACPNCGYLLKEEEIKYTDNFDCPRCKDHYSNYDFWQEQQFKWSREMIEEI